MIGVIGEANSVRIEWNGLNTLLWVIFEKRTEIVQTIIGNFLQKWDYYG